MEPPSAGAPTFGFTSRTRNSDNPMWRAHSCARNRLVPSPRPAVSHRCFRGKRRRVGRLVCPAKMRTDSSTRPSSACSADLLCVLRFSRSCRATLLVFHPQSPVRMIHNFPVSFVVKRFLASNSRRSVTLPGFLALRYSFLSAVFSQLEG